MHVQKVVAYEYENSREVYEETARRWVIDFAKDPW